MGFLAPTLVLVFAFILVVRAGAIALMMTGMDAAKANFQALSAFSGTGFTTREAELIVNHPQRRRIATWLMILGNAGIISVMITATSSMVTSTGYHRLIVPVVLLVGLYVLYRIARYRGITSRLDRFMENRLIRSPFFRQVTTQDLVHLADDYGVVQTAWSGNMSK